MHRHNAVATKHRLMSVNKILGNGMTNTLIDKLLTGTDSVVTLGAESVVDVQTYHHSAVAATHRAMGVDNHRVAQSRI